VRYNQPLLGLFSDSTAMTLSKVSDSIAMTLAKVKVRETADLFVCASSAVFGLITSAYLWRKHDRLGAFLFYWSFAALSIFSYAGEKGPWLTGHVIYPMILLVAYYFRHLLADFDMSSAVTPTRRFVFTLLFIVACSYQLRLAILVNHIDDGEPHELFSQVHNHRDVKFVMNWIHETSLKTGEKHENIPFALVGEPTWAFYFYLLEGGYKKFKLDPNALDGTERFIISDERILAQRDQELIQKGYKKTQLIHSGWWVPQDSKMEWLDWLNYMWTHYTTKTGTRPLIVYYKPLFAEG
jgi:hypothetical protein